MESAAAWTDDMSLALKFVSYGGGHALKILMLGHKMLPRKCIEADVAAGFLRDCPNITSLSICGNISIWTEAFGEKLQVLEVSATSGLGAISRNCPCLRLLTIHSISRRNRHAINVPICDRSAPTLRSLKVVGCLLSDDLIEKIQETCRKLRRISIIGNIAVVSRLKISVSTSPSRFY